MAHTVNDPTVQGNRDSTLQGIDQIYMKVIQVYTFYQEQLQTQLLNHDFWKCIAWGLGMMSKTIRSYEKVYDEKISALESATDDQKPEIEFFYQQYYMPYMTFIGNYLQMAIA